MKQCLELLAFTLALSFAFETTGRTYLTSGLPETKKHNIIYTQTLHKWVADDPQVECTRAIERVES